MVSSGRGPRVHRIQTPNGGNYQYGGPKKRSGEPWECVCGNAFGQGEVAALQHLAVKAKQAWRRLNNMKALAAAAVGAGPQDEHEALSLLYRTRHWVSHDGIRRRLVPYYDSRGTLAAIMDWPALANDVTIGRVTGGDADVLILRIAIAIAGTPIQLELSGLRQLPTDDARRVREALNTLLPGDENDSTD